MRFTKPLCILILALLLPATQACAQVLVDIPYEGVYYPVTEHNVQLYLPGDWTAREDSPSVLRMGPADSPQALTLSIVRNGGYTMDMLLASFEEDPLYSEAVPVFFGDTPFVWYASDADDLFGGATLSTDGRFLYFFTFAPYADEALRATAISILSTLVPVR